MASIFWVITKKVKRVEFPSDSYLRIMWALDTGAVTSHRFQGHSHLPSLAYLQCDSRLRLSHRPNSGSYYWKHWHQAERTRRETRRSGRRSVDPSLVRYGTGESGAKTIRLPFLSLPVPHQRRQKHLPFLPSTRAGHVFPRRDQSVIQPRGLVWVQLLRQDMTVQRLLSPTGGREAG